MSLTNPNTPVSQQDLQDFYHKILPYMGGSSGGGGHTIEDSEGTDLTQRDTLQFGEGFKAEDDDTNEKTVISPDVMQSGDMSDVITPLPSVAPKKEGIKYSTTEQVVGEWIDGKPLYSKTVNFGALPNKSTKEVAHNISDLDAIVAVKGIAFLNDNSTFYPLPYTSPDALGDNILLIVTKTLIRIMTGYNRSNLTNSYITVYYTKTTDTPNT